MKKDGWELTEKSAKIIHHDYCTCTSDYYNTQEQTFKDIFMEQFILIYI